MPYEDIHLEIRALEDGKYRVFIEGLRPKDVTVKPQPVQDAVSQVENLLKVEFRKWQPLSRPRPCPLSDVGEALFKGFFESYTEGAEKKRTLWQLVNDNLKAIDEIASRAKRRNKSSAGQQETPKKRLRLQFDSKLAVQPWEAMHLGKEPLARLRDLSLVRSLPGAQQSLTTLMPDDESQPLNMIVVLSSPTDCPLDLEEWEITNCLEDLVNVNLIKLKFVKHEPGRALLDQLIDRIREIGAERPCVVHIVAHGEYRNGQGNLFFESESGVSQPVPAATLVRELSALRKLRLVVLNACHGGARPASRPFTSIAEKLLLAGVPAVVAMQFEISNEAAVRFAKVFYKFIANGAEIDEALSRARGLLTMVRGELTADTSIEWCTPVFFLDRRCQSTALIPNRTDDHWLREAKRWDKENEPKRALSATRLILKREGAGDGDGDGDNEIQESARMLMNLVCLSAHRESIDSLDELEKSGKPAEVIAVSDRILEDAPDLDNVKEARKGAEGKIDIDLRRRFEAGLTRLGQRRWGRAQRHFDKCAHRAGAVLRRAQQCNSAIKYLRPAEIASDCCGLFDYGEQCLRNGLWTEAKSAFHIITELRLKDFPQLLNFHPLHDEAQQMPIYIDGLAAEKQNQWKEAAAAYQQLSPGFRDREQRLPYALGRAAEAEELWETAASNYLGCQEDYRDAGEHLLYCQGRVAEAQADKLPEWQDVEAREAWRGVIEGFGDLNDAYRDHDVEHRRAYARGRIAEAEGMWNEVISNFKPLPDTYREGDVQQRRRYANGRLAFGGGNWKDAKEWFEKLDGDRDAGFYCGYAQAMMDVTAGLSAKADEAAKLLAQAAAKFEKLPDSFAQTKQWRAYVTGVLAEAANQWQTAATAYRDIPLDWRGDLRNRLPYAEGRAAESAEGGENWEEAAKCYGRCESSHRDVAKRLAYCSGLAAAKQAVAKQAAAKQEDWQGVIVGFGGLDDSYRDGEVGRLRAYARGWIAEADGNWEGVLQEFKLEGGVDLPDDYRDTGARRGYARGQMAKKKEDWAGIIKGFAALPGKYRDGQVGKLRLYARGRLAETQEWWHRAARAFRAVRDHFPDANERCAYATGRAADGQGKWEEVADAFQSLPDTYRDVSEHKSYAQGRVALQAGQWVDAESSFKSLGGSRDAAQFLNYARGRAAAGREEWEAASGALRALPAWWREAEVDRWLAYAQGRRYEERGQWGAALEAYQPLPDDFPEGSRDIVQRRMRLAHLMQVAPWMDGLTRAHLLRDPAGCWDGVSPYDALAPAGITPDSSSKEIKDASFVMMEKGLMTPAGRLAWDRLRSGPERLKVDALMYRLRQVEELRRFQQTVGIISGAELKQQACRAAPDDAPLLNLLGGRREEAVADWGKQQQQRPYETATAHALAIACLSRAKELEGRRAYEQAGPVWEQAIANWALLLVDDAYWRDWRNERRTWYQVAISDGDLATLRSELGNFLSGELAWYADRYQMAGQSQRAEKYRQLMLTFEVELEGARVLKEVGGLPAGGGSDAPVCAGAVFIRHLHLEEALAKRVLDLEQEREHEDDDPPLSEDIFAAMEAVLEGGAEQATLFVTPEMLSRLRCAFSELGRAAVLLERHRYEEALTALTAKSYRLKITELPSDCEPEQRQAPEHFAQCDQCQMFARANPAYLLLPYRSVKLLRDAADLAVRIHLAAAQTAITSGDGVAEPLDHWREAIAISRNAGTQVRTKQAVVRAAIGRASALEREQGRWRGQRLTEALELLEAVGKLAGGVDEAQLKGKQSELLTDRGVWHGHGCHRWEVPSYERATDDLRRALVLNPDSLHARDNLSRSLIFYAANLMQIGEHSQAIGLLAEAFSILDDGLRRFGNHRQLQAVLRRGLQELEEATRISQGVEAAMRQLEEVLKSTTPVSPAAAVNVQAMRDQARQKRQSGDVKGEILDLIQAVHLQADDESVRRELLDALQRLAGETGGNGNVQGSAN